MRAKGLRKRMSPPELMIWALLRPKVNRDFNLRRQTPLLDRFVVDFFFDPLRIAFEIDGRTFHEDQADYDFARDVELAEHGVSTVRIAAYRVFQNAGEIANMIRMICMGELLLTDLDPAIVTLARDSSVNLPFLTNKTPLQAGGVSIQSKNLPN